MYKAVAIMLVLGTVVGVMMPAAPPVQQSTAAAAPTEVSVIAVERDREPQQVSGSEIRLRRRANGHFYADAQVNGTTVEFLIDTGATSVALTREDAQRAGLRFNDSEVEVVAQGASGEVWGKFVTIDRLSLGSKSARDVYGTILQGSEQSLLGQAFLSQFASVEIRDDTMVLR